MHRFDRIFIQVPGRPRKSGAEFRRHETAANGQGSGVGAVVSPTSVSPNLQVEGSSHHWGGCLQRLVTSDAQYRPAQTAGLQLPRAPPRWSCRAAVRCFLGEHSVLPDASLVLGAFPSGEPRDRDPEGQHLFLLFLLRSVTPYR